MSALRFSNTFILAGTAIDETIFGAFTADANCVVTQVQISCQTPPVGADITVDLIDIDDVELDHVSTLDDGGDSQVTVFDTPIALSAGDTIRAKVKSVGSTTPGEFLVVTIIGNFNLDETDEMWPNDIDLCALYGYQYINGQPAEDTRVFIKLNNVPVASATTVFENSPQHADTDEAGHWSLDVVQGQNYLLTIWKAGILNQSIVIPFTATCNVASLI